MRLLGFFCFFLFITVNSLTYSQIQYPLVIDLQFVYLKRAPKIHNKKALCQLVNTTTTSGIEDFTVLDASSCPHNTFKTTNILASQKFAPAGRLTVSYLIDKKQTWEGRYLGPLHWHGFASASCPNSLEFPFSNGENNTADYQNANSMRGTCDTRLWTSEVNYWYHVTPQRVDYFSVSWVFGMRYFNLDEYFDLVSNTNYGSSHYRIWADNKMFGPQLGGDLEGNLGCNFTWGLIGKLGALINFAQNKTLFKDYANTRVVQSYNPSDFNLTFLGEIAPFILFNLSKSVLFKISYELTYLSNIALAMNQITFDEEDLYKVKNHVNIGGSFMYYGLFAGLGLEF
jgi:hypothetical protein